MAKQMQISVQKAVILLNFGGPKDLEAVSSVLYEILRDPNTIQLPLPFSIQNLLARRITKKRTPLVREQYQQIGGKSPIIEATEHQRFQLEAAIVQRNLPIKVYAMHRYIVGDAERIIQQIIEDQIEEVLLIPMYPHFSWTTTGSAISQCLDIINQKGFKGNIQAIRSYPTQPLYLDALSDLLQSALKQHKLDVHETLILCSAHGLPQSYITKGDPYFMELLGTVEELRKRFPSWKFQLCFQSRVGPARWLQPYTDELIKVLPQQGVRSILFLPISFVNDHLETLYEVNHTYFELARSFGLTPFSVPALETHPQFIELLLEKTMLWDQGVQGMKPQILLPPSQHFFRYDRWVLIFWCLAFFLSILNALT